MANIKSNELNLQVEFEDTFDIDNFSKSEQDIFSVRYLKTYRKFTIKNKQKSKSVISTLYAFRPALEKVAAIQSKKTKDTLGISYFSGLITAHRITHA